MMIVKESRWIKKLRKRVVNLQQKGIRDAEMEQIYQNDCRDIHHLQLSRNLISFKGLLHFSKVNWNELTFLSLNGNNIGDMGCKYLTRASIPQLTTLKLAQNKITGGGVLHLSKGQWKMLQSISIYANILGSRSVQWLIRGNWSHIYFLNIHRKYHNEKRNGLKDEQLLKMILTQSTKITYLRLQKNLMDKTQQKYMHRVLTQKFSKINQLFYYY